MKKLGFVVFIVVMSFGLTACKSKKLTCTMTTSSSEDLKLVETLTLTFSGNEVTNMDILSEIHMAGNYTNYVSELEQSVQQKYSELEGKKGIQYETEHDENTITLKISAHLKKMNQESKDLLSIVNTKQSDAGAKKELEEKGYVCQ